jgi:hypothetical protein
MLYIVKRIRHSTLKRSTYVLKTEGKFPIGESTPRTNKRSFMLVLRSDVNLIIAGESIHERKYFIAGTVIDDLVEKRGWKVVLWTGFVNIPIINTNTYTTTFLINQYRVGNPFCQSYGINKTSFKKFFNFEFNGCRFTWMDRTEALPYWFSSKVHFYLMHDNSKVNTGHLFVTPGKDITKFLEQSSIGDNFLWRTRSSNVNIFNYPRFN